MEWSSTAIESSPAASQPTSGVTGSRDPAGQHWVRFEVRADLAHVQLGKDRGTWLAAGEPLHDAGSPLTHLVCTSVVLLKECTRVLSQKG